MVSLNWFHKLKNENSLKKILLKVKVSQNLMGKRKPEGALSKCGLLGSPSDTLIH